MEDLCPENKKSFDVMETALFNVALDDYFLPTEMVYNARNTFHAMNGHNRWYDKSLTIIGMPDGRMGMNGEHSPCDALVPAFLFDYALRP
jgi:carnitine O-acetyltransferase